MIFCVVGGGLLCCFRDSGFRDFRDLRNSWGGNIEAFSPKRANDMKMKDCKISILCEKINLWGIMDSVPFCFSKF